MNSDGSDLKKALELQAYVDGELSPEDRRRVEAVLLEDPESREWVSALGGVSKLIRSGEPEVFLSESREFYWSAIEREIRRAAVPARQPWGIAGWLRVHGWLRWAIPAVAAGVMLLIFQPSIWRSSSVAVLSLNREVELESEDSVAFTFRSEHSGMSVVWVKGRHDF